MGQMVAIPPTQRPVASILKNHFQRRRLNMAVAKQHVDFAPMTSQEISVIRCLIQLVSHKFHASIGTISNGHHVAWNNDLGFIEQLPNSQLVVKLPGFGCTFSDITQRFIPSLILAAYPDNKITRKLALKVLADTPATAPFKTQHDSNGYHDGK
jgi:hypothetical protein